MGKSLCEASKAARALYHEAARILGWDLAKVCFEGPESELTETRVCQPALFVHGLALEAVLKERGGLPCVEMALGLSLGEITAYASAGVFDFPTGLRIVAERGRLMQGACERGAGAMAAVVGEARDSVLRICAEFDIEAANFNAPGQVIVSGEAAKVAALVAAARERRIIVKALNVAGAYHSRLMEPARTAFEAFLRDIAFAAPRFRVFTNTTGRAIKEPAEIKAALVRQVVSPVLWEDCMRSAAGAGATEFWELGPGAVLAGLARRIEKSWIVRSFAERADLPA